MRVVVHNVRELLLDRVDDVDHWLQTGVPALVAPAPAEDGFCSFVGDEPESQRTSLNG